MKLSLARGGGVAGLRKPPLELDTTELPATASAQLHALVADANLGAQPRSIGEAHPDELGYTLSVTEDDGRTHTVDLALSLAPPALRTLISEIRRLAKP